MVDMNGLLLSNGLTMHAQVLIAEDKHTIQTTKKRIGGLTEFKTGPFPKMCLPNARFHIISVILAFVDIHPGVTDYTTLNSVATTHRTF